jgi:hypothetical protein
METYMIRTTVERSINYMKDILGLAKQKTQNEKTLHADLILSGITQLISVVLADKIHALSSFYFELVRCTNSSFF